MIARVIRDSGDDIDVHVISHATGRSGGAAATAAGDAAAAARDRRSASRRRCSCRRSRSALAQVRDHFGLPSVLLLFLLAVIVVAAVGGLWPALGAAVAGIPPRQLVLHAAALHVHDQRGREPARARDLPRRRGDGQRARVARGAPRERGRAARAEAETLARLAGASSVGRRCSESVRADVRASTGVDTWHRKDDWHGDADASVGTARQSEAETAHRVDRSMCLRSAGRPVRRGGAPAARRLRHRARLANGIEELEAGASEADDLERANDLRLAILSAVSHDLRTPLAAIKASVTSLLDQEVDWSDGRPRRVPRHHRRRRPTASTRSSAISST